MLGKSIYGKSDADNWRASSLNRKDPNAMDIDTMIMERQTYLMKQGLCFKCEGHGHLARDCKGKKRDTSPKKNINDSISWAFSGVWFISLLLYCACPADLVIVKLEFHYFLLTYVGSILCILFAFSCIEKDWLQPVSTGFRRFYCISQTVRPATEKI